MAIPKIIHYCWFGGNPLPELALKCIESWKKFCPDYKIIEWNEKNFDINYNVYVKEAYETKKWAFVSDVARLYALVTVGGVYMDTDVELIKPIDCFLEYEAFSGFESVGRMPTGIMASEKDSSFMIKLLKDYDGERFLREDGSYDNTSNVIRITKACMEAGFSKKNVKQTYDGFTLFPSEYFCPMSYETRQLELTDNTYAIHHFNGSWLTDTERTTIIIRKHLKRFMPHMMAAHTAKFLAYVKVEGLKKAVGETFKFFKK